MEGSDGALSVKAGQPVALVFYADGIPFVIQSRVAAGPSFALETSDANVLHLESSRRVVLVSQESESVLKAETEVSGISRQPSGWRIELARLSWEATDRRRFPRFALRIAVTIRRVEERPGLDTRIVEARGETEDISFGGAWVKSRELLESGTLVEFRAILSETESVRALAVVAHSAPERGGMGLEFVDYIAGTKAHLNSFLSRVAA